jgi:hypothetical protein
VAPAVAVGGHTDIGHAIANCDCTQWLELGKAQTEVRLTAGGLPPVTLFSILQKERTPHRGGSGDFPEASNGLTGGWSKLSGTGSDGDSLSVDGCGALRRRVAFAAGPSHSVGPTVLVSVSSHHHFQPSLSGLQCISVCNSTSPMPSHELWRAIPFGWQ